MTKAPNSLTFIRYSVSYSYDESNEMEVKYNKGTHNKYYII